MFKIRALIIAMLVTLVAFSSACSVSQNGGANGDVVSEIEDGSDSQWFIDPVVVEENDDTEEVEVEVEDDVEDGAEAEEIDENSVEDEPSAVQLLDIDIDTDAVVEDYYSQDFKALDMEREYDWTIEGLPEDTGLEFGKVGMADWKARLEGKPTTADIGTHTITVTVADAENAADSDSITFELTVQSNVDIPTMSKSTKEHVCKKPLIIKASWVSEDDNGNTEEKEIVGPRKPLLGAAVRLKIEARRGDEPAYGQVEFKIRSSVKNGLHCKAENRGNLGIENPMESGPNYRGKKGYEYYWINGGDCDAESSHNARIVKRVTKNPTWRITGSVENDGSLGDKIYRSHNGRLGIEGSMLYDGPLRVAELPVDEHAVEYLDIKAEDACSDWTNPEVKGTALRSQIGARRLELNIVYPSGKHGGPGGLGELKVDIRYTDLRDYKFSDDIQDYFEQLQDVDDDDTDDEDSDEDEWESYFKFKDCPTGEMGRICEMNNYLAVLFVPERGLGQRPLDEFRNDLDITSALKSSMGYTVIDLEELGENQLENNYGNEEEDGDEELEYGVKEREYGGEDDGPSDTDNFSVERTATVSSNSDLTKVKRVVLMWKAPKPDILYGSDARGYYLDMDIIRIKFSTRYWTATFLDSDNLIDNDVVEELFVREDWITDRNKYTGMSDANASGGVFKRRELAGYIGE